MKILTLDLLYSKGKKDQTDQTLASTWREPLQPQEGFLSHDLCRQPFHETQSCVTWLLQCFCVFSLSPTHARSITCLCVGNPTAPQPRAENSRFCTSVRGCSGLDLLDQLPQSVCKFLWHDAGGNSWCVSIMRTVQHCLGHSQVPFQFHNKAKGLIMRADSKYAQCHMAIGQAA